MFQVIVSDFCLEPTEFTLQLVPQGQVKDAAVYYLTCSGNSPSYTYVYDADYDIRYLNYYTQTLLSASCSGNAALGRSSSIMSSISNVHIPVVEDLASCVEYYNTWNTFVEVNQCIFNYDHSLNINYSFKLFLGWHVQGYIWRIIYNLDLPNLDYFSVTNLHYHRN